MKILTVSDVVVDMLHSSLVTERFQDVDLILSCGDLPHDYLEYLVTMLAKPLYFVHGNHAQSLVIADSEETKDAPEGCIDIHRRTVNYRGLLIGGLEGSMRYREGEHQYGPSAMRRMIWMMTPRLWRNKRRYGRAIDILITHAPPLGIHDGQDLCHTGFQAYLDFMDRWEPLYLIHGHTHLYRQDTTRITKYKNTTVINTYGYQVIEIPQALLDERAGQRSPQPPPDQTRG